MLAATRADLERGVVGDEVRYERDLALAAAAAAGDRAAAAALTRRVLPVVRRTARALSPSPSDAEDAVQIALLEVLRAVGAYRGTGPIEAWARRIASRAVIRHARRSRRERPMASTDDERTEHMSTTVVDSLPRPLEDYLGELPQVQRTAIVLRHALGHTVPEIAELTEAPIPTVKSRLKRAHQELRRLVQRDLNLGVRVEHERRPS